MESYPEAMHSIEATTKCCFYWVEDLVPQLLPCNMPYGTKYSYSYSTLSCSPKGLDFKMLLDPFEKEFHLPTVFIKQSSLLSRYFNIIGQIDNSSVQRFIIKYNSTQLIRIVLDRSITCQFYQLVTKDTSLIVICIDVLLYSITSIWK